MVAKRVIVPYTGNPATFTVPADFSTFTRLRLIGGGVCGSPGFNGAVDNEDLRLPNISGGTFSNGFAGPGGWYIEKTSAPTVAFAPGQVLQCHIAQPAAAVANLQTWEDNVFGGVPPLCLSDDTWLKDNGGNVFARAPGGDSSSAVVGNVQISGGSWNTTIPRIASSGGAPGAGGPAGLPSHATQDGAQPGLVNPTQIKFMGSGAGSGNLDEGVGLPGVGSRTAAGAGGGGGASAGGAGGAITGAAAASSSLLLPSLTNPAAADGIIADANFLFGAGDFTIEVQYQQTFQSAGVGALVAVGDIGNNQRSWVFGYGHPFGAPCLFRSDNGMDWGPPIAPPPTAGQISPNQDLLAQYTSGSFYFGPNNVFLAFAHFVVCREAGQLRIFQNGFPGVWFVGGGHNFTYAADDPFVYFPSTAPLTIGCVLNNGVVNTVDDDGTGISLPTPGWFGQVRITIGAALYTCPAFSDDPAGIGQAFVPPAAPLVGGNFNCNWPGVKGATATVATGANLTFVGAAQIDSDQYCYPPAVPETGAAGVAGTDGNLWGGVGPGGGGGGAGGDLGRHRLLTGGAGGKGGKYGGGGGQGGGVNSGVYNTMGNPAAAPGLGGIGEGGVLVFEYDAAAAGDSRAFMLGVS